MYPGATHSRFEHSLGTMELAGRALDSAFRNSEPQVLKGLGLDAESGGRTWAVKTARLGGLLHDIGHPPFSHATEALLPLGLDGRRLDHERFTERLITEGEVAAALVEDPVDGVDVASVADVAVGTKYRTIKSPVVRLLSDLVTGTVGVDRMD